MQAKVDSIAGSTAEIDYPGISDEYGRFMEARAGRAAAAEAARLARSEAISKRIGEALGAAQLSHPMATLVGVVERSERRLGRRPPSRPTIRADILHRRETEKSRTEVGAPFGHALIHPST